MQYLIIFVLRQLHSNSNIHIRFSYQKSKVTSTILLSIQAIIKGSILDTFHISQLEIIWSDIIAQTTAISTILRGDPFSLSDSVVKISPGLHPFIELCPFRGGLSHVSPMLATYVRQSWPHSAAYVPADFLSSFRAPPGHSCREHRAACKIPNAFSFRDVV